MKKYEKRGLGCWAAWALASGWPEKYEKYVKGNMKII
jgi:hypothetical protein